jgi:integrase
MARAQKRLSARKVASFKLPKGSKRKWLADGGGLGLQVTASASGGATKCFTFRFQKNKVRGEIGLGAANAITLAEARLKAREHRRQLADGVSPLAIKRAQEAQRKTEAAKGSPLTFGQAAAQYIAAKEPEWKNGVHRAQWRSTIETHCALINNLPVAAIDTDLVLKVLEPIWKTKTETARRVRSRIERVLTWAAVDEKFRSGANPARWKGHLSEKLPKPSKVAKTRHFPALPYKDVGDFMAELRRRDSDSARCLELTILCATRSSETLGMRWDEIDFDERAWTIPKERIKAGKEHRVPLSDRAIAILEQRHRHRDGDRVFNLSNMAMLQLLRGMRPGVTVHGTARSTFRDWAGETTGFPHDICEAALAHVRGDKAVKAYARGDLFNKRRKLMDVWSAYCAKPSVKTKGKTKTNVVPLRSRERV